MANWPSLSWFFNKTSKKMNLLFKLEILIFKDKGNPSFLKTP